MVAAATTERSTEGVVAVEGTENPFMALVDAATSILDKNQKDEDQPGCDEGLPEDPPANTNIGDDATTPAANSNNKSSISSNSSNANSGSTELVKKASFAEILMSVLNDESNMDVLSWMPDGMAFTIVNPKKFSLDAMPKLFNIRNMSSFVRKLGRWGFQRVHERETRNSDIFKHPSFQKNRPDLCAKIKCVGRLTRTAATATTPNGTSATTTTTSSAMTNSHSPTSSSSSLSDTMMGHHHHHHHNKRIMVDSIRVPSQHQHQQQMSSSTMQHSLLSAARYRTPQELLFLEEARRLSTSLSQYQASSSASHATSASSSNGGGHRSLPPPPHHGTHSVHNLTSQVVHAALETLRRDERASPSLTSASSSSTSSSPSTSRHLSSLFGTKAAAAAAAAAGLFDTSASDLLVLKTLQASFPSTTAPILTQYTSGARGPTLALAACPSNAAAAAATSLQLSYGGGGSRLAAANSVMVPHLAAYLR